jgi:hypothetical protein
MDPDAAIFVTELQNAKKKLIIKKSFPAYCFLKVHLHNFSKVKRPKEVKKHLNLRNQGFSYYFCLLTEGSGPCYGRPKIMWIRIRIRNIARYDGSLVSPASKSTSQLSRTTLYKK